jgi:ArsR family transcriptional regulator
MIGGMAVGLPTISPRTKQAGGCCDPLVEPDVTADQAERIAGVAKALGDPTRLQIVDAARKAAPEAVCVCELQPLFEISQPAISRHLKVLRDAGVLAVERRGLWAYYFIPGDSALEVLRSWLD